MACLVITHAFGYELAWHRLSRLDTLSLIVINYPVGNTQQLNILLFIFIIRTEYNFRQDRNTFWRQRGFGPGVGLGELTAGASYTDGNGKVSGVDVNARPGGAALMIVLATAIPAVRPLVDPVLGLK